MGQNFYRYLFLFIILTPLNISSHNNEPHTIKGSSKADSMTQCVEPTEIMQKEHFVFLYHQRDKTVIDGIRTKQHSLANCIDCHVGYDEKGVAIPINSEGQFCQTCHVQTAVNIDCFSCHATVPRDKGMKRIKASDNNNHLSDKIKDITVNVESDWSSVSYFYSIIAISKKSHLEIGSYFKNSIQGDKKLVEIYSKLGVKTEFIDNKIILEKDTECLLPKNLDLDLTENPDIAQTIAVTCFGLGISCNIKGLHTLKIKETDRLVALKNEIEKLGGKIEITDYSLKLYPSFEIKKNISIKTYNDHRMAMAFAPLSLLVPIYIENPDVVTKSYKNFWSDLKAINFEISR